MKRNSKVKFISAFLAFMMIFLSLPINVLQIYAAGEPQAVIDSTSARPGDTVELSIILKNAPAIKSMSASNITYDSAKVTLTKVEWLCDAEIKNWNVSQGRGVLTFGENTDANGPVLKMTFAVSDPVEDADVAVNCTMTVMRMDDANNEIPIDIEIVSGHINIYNAIRGDVDGNEKINSNDAVYLLYHVMFGADAYPINQNGDMDGNGKVNSNDAVYLLYHVMFGEEEYPFSVQCQHNLSATAANAATCTETGNIAYWTCEKCGKIFSDENGRNEIALAVTVIEATGHTVVVDSAVPATYTGTGLTEGSHCSVCGTVIQEQEVIPQLQKDEYSIQYFVVGNDEYLQGIAIDNPNPTSYTPDTGVAWLDDLVVPGYNFEGWYDGQGNEASKVTSIPAGTSRNIKLYAKWTKQEYTITFDNSSMNLPSATKTYTVDQKVTLDKPTVDRYVFLGWTTDKDELVSEIKPGTTGNFTLHSNWTSKRNLAKPVDSLGAPIIVEDTVEGKILFTYEIGQIENVPLYTIKNLPSAGGVVSVYTETVTKAISTTDASTIATAIDKITTDSTAWTLSEDWNDTTHVEDAVLEEHGMDRASSQSVGKTSGNTYTLTTENYDKTVVATNEGAVATTKLYDINEVDSRATWESKASLSVSDTESTKYTDSANVSAEVGVGFGPVSAKMSASMGTSTEISSSSTAGASTETTVAHENKSHSKTGTEKTVVEDNTKTTTTDKGWNKSTSASDTSSSSLTDFESKTLSERIANEYKYGQSYAKGGSNSTSADWSTSSGESKQYSSTLTYFNSQETTEGVSYEMNGENDGSYRLVRAGIVHVFAVVIYDIANAQYSVTTYSVLDDDTYTYIDYSATSAAKFDDNENSVLPFEIPYFVNDYVNGRIVASEDLKYNARTLSVVEYEGDNTSVVIPEFFSVDNLDGTHSAYTVRNLGAETFSGNAEIKSVLLSNYIREIPNSAFAGCTSLQFVYGSEICAIGDNAFDGCVSLGEFKVASTIESIGNNAFRGVDSIVVNASNQDVVFGAIRSGAKRITINISEIAEEMRDVTLEIPATVEYFELQGGGKTFSGLEIKSEAGETVLNGITIVEGTGIPLEISSEAVTLNQVNVEASSYVLLLKGNAPTISLYGTSAFTSASENTVVCRNTAFEKISSNLSTKLEITGNLLSYGTPVNASLIGFPVRGEIVSISEAQYDQFIKGSMLIALDANGGSVSPCSLSRNSGYPLGELPVPVREHYQFTGWFTEDGTRISADTICDSSITLYAHWELLPYTVNWETPENAMITVERTSSPNANASTGELSSGATVYYGDVLSVTYAVSTGYTLSSKGETSITVTGNVTSVEIYATATVYTYTVVYDANGGSGTTPQSTHMYGVAKALTANGFSRTDYTFLGWSTDSNAETPTYSDQQSVINLATSDNVTLYAVWLKTSGLDGYYSRGDKDDTECEIWANKSKTESFYTGLDKAALSRAGYTKISINITIDAWEQWVLMNVTPRFRIYNSNGTSMFVWTWDGELSCANTPNDWKRQSFTFDLPLDCLQTDGSVKVQYYSEAQKDFFGTDTSGYHIGTVVLKATAKIEGSMLITLDANGGSVSPSFVCRDVGYPLGELPVPVRKHYQFTGWFTEDGTQVNADTTCDSDATLYAHWELLPYTANWDTPANATITVKRTSSPKANAPTGTLSSGATVYYGDVLSVTYAASTGYTLSSNGATSITVTGNVTSAQIYAATNVITYTVVYNANGGSGTTAQSTHTYDVAKALTANGFSRTDHTFLGWSTDSNAQTPTYSDQQSVINLATSGSITLYAVWLKTSGSAGYYSRGDEGDKECEIWDKNSKIESFYIGLDQAALRRAGYTKISINITIDAWENYLFLDPTPRFRIYNSNGASLHEWAWDGVLKGKDWKRQSFTFDLPLDCLQTDGSVKVQYLQSSDNVIYHLGTVVLEATAKK